MHVTVLAAAGFLVITASICTALAQTAAPDRTGTGGGPGSTITAPNTNSLGVTKPPAGASDPAPTSREEREYRREQAIDRRIETEVCKGCD